MWELESWVCRCDGIAGTKPAVVPAARPGNCWPARRVIGHRYRQISWGPDHVDRGCTAQLGSVAWPGANRAVVAY